MHSASISSLFIALLLLASDPVRSCTTSSGRSSSSSSSLSAKASSSSSSSSGSSTAVIEPEGKRFSFSPFPQQFALTYTGGLKLTGGLNSSYGIVEITYGNIWGTICDDGMTITSTSGETTASVICNLLGYPPSTTKAIWFSLAIRNVPAGYSIRQSQTRTIWLDDFYCRGNETSVNGCVHTRPGQHNCVRSENIGVVCKSSTIVTTTAPSDSTVSTDLTTTAATTVTATSSVSTTITTESSSTTSTVTATHDQNVTPTLREAAVTSTCGHSQYYNNIDLPGAGIVGGVIAKVHQYPWIARLRIATRSGTVTCGGTIISSNYILTAGHCATGSVTGMTAYLGDHDASTTDTGEMAVTVSSWTPHPSYAGEPSYDYDFALLRLSQKLNFTSSWNIQPICLPSSCETGCTTASSVVYIAGWGTTSSSGTSISRYLRAAYVQIGDWTVCHSQYDDLTDRMICAGYLEGGVDTCQGDSGGPLMSAENGYFKLCGVTSTGYGCGLPNYYGIYSKVCAVLDWIKITAGMS